MDVTEEKVFDLVTEDITAEAEVTKHDELLNDKVAEVEKLMFELLVKTFKSEKIKCWVCVRITQL